MISNGIDYRTNPAMIKMRDEMPGRLLRTLA